LRLENGHNAVDIGAAFAKRTHAIYVTGSVPCLSDVVFEEEHNGRICFREVPKQQPHHISFRIVLRLVFPKFCITYSKTAPHYPPSPPWAPQCAPKLTAPSPLRKPRSQRRFVTKRGSWIIKITSAAPLRREHFASLGILLATLMKGWTGPTLALMHVAVWIQMIAYTSRGFASMETGAAKITRTLRHSPPSQVLNAAASTSV
jgi:hypothetical protein